MIKNYLTIALRNVRKHPLYAGLNVVGLAVGIACCLLIGLYVLDELSYERVHERRDRIVRIAEDKTSGEGYVSRLAVTYGPLAPALEADFPIVEHAVRVLPYPMLVRRDAQKHQERGFLFVDSTFLDVFSFPLVHGDARTALDAPFSVLLTPAMAAKYFGDGDPVGRTLTVRDDETSHDFTVTGVVAAPPRTTHLQFDFLASFASMRTIYSDYIESPDNWYHPPMYTYALLAEGVSPDDLQTQMPAFVERRLGERHGIGRSLHVERLADIRLRSGREQDLVPGSDITYVYLFALIALFILLLACINFMNLATARATQRAKEVGLRKALGAVRGQLIRQFLTESILLAALATALAGVLAEGLLPVFNAVAGKALPTALGAYGMLPLALVGIVALVGVAAGSYPAFYLSRFRPARVLKGTTTARGPSAARFRQGLVVFQFAVSIVLILGALVVYRQLDFVQNQRLGFDKEHVVIVPLRDLDNQYHHDAIKRAWTALPGVEHVAGSSGMPGLEGGRVEDQIKPDHAALDSLTLMVLVVDPAYAETYGLEIVAGRDFSEDFPTDTAAAFLINEAAARRLGWTDPVGQTLSLDVWFGRQFYKEGTVVGVVRDFHYHSMHRAVEPMLFHILPNSYYYDYLAARLRPGDVPATLAAMEQAWAAFNPERPFEYMFLDTQFDALYQAEERLGQLFGLFAGLAVLIACLGLFGLAAFSAEQRTKEIGVRKVLGASVPDLVALLSRDFLLLVGVAFVVAAPLAYLAAERWLEGFAYRTEMGLEVFALTGLLALVIAFMTVSYQAVRTALADPVKSLRYE